MSTFNKFFRLPAAFARLQTRGIHSSPLAKAAAGAAEGAVAAPERYAKSLRVMHWVIAMGFVGSAGTIHMSYRTQGETKDFYMKLHNTFGVIMTAAVLPRVFLRLSTKVPGHLPGNALEHLGATLGHLALYGTMLFLPVSGIAMVWYGGAGQPLLALSLPGKGNKTTAEDGDISKHAFKLHKEVGEIFTNYLLPLHVGAAGYHVLRGHATFARITPFAA